MKYLALIIFCLSTSFSLTPSQLQEKQTEISVYVFLEEKCPISQYYSLSLRELYEEYHAQGVSFAAYFPFESSTTEKVKAYKEKYQLPFKCKVDENQYTALAMEATITPEVFVLDEKGELKYQGRIDNAFERPGKRRRVVTNFELKDAIKSLLAGEEPKVGKTQAVGCYITFKNY